MPELPDIEIYIERLDARIHGSTLEAVRLASPFLLRTVEPPIESARGRRVEGLRRIGKRIAIGLEEDLFLVIHLMIAGRLRWVPDQGGKIPAPRGSRDKAAGALIPIPARVGLAAFDFSTGTLLLTEASKKRRASLHVVRGEAAVQKLDPGGLEVIGAELPLFREALLRENRTLKRALTDPRLFSGIGNAYSDEILHAARLSPVTLTQRLDEAEIERLHRCTGEVLRAWTERLRAERPESFPAKVTAFREGMAVHGRYRRPCPDCGSPVQRIVYAANEANYCARCQTGGKLLADRALSRLLRGDWPRTLEDLEEARATTPRTG